MFLEKITLKGNKLRIHIYIISIAVIFIGAILLFNYVQKANRFKLLDDVTITNTLDESISSNTYWCGALNIAWQEFVKMHVNQDLGFTSQSDKLTALNSYYFPEDSMSASYTLSGIKSLELKNKLESDIYEKYEEVCGILGSVKWPSAKTDNVNNYLIYSRLNKKFEFETKFSDLGKSSFGEVNNLTDNVKYFGIDENTSESVYSQVQVLYYNSETDYAIKLITTSGDDIILCVGEINTNLGEIYQNILTSSEIYLGNNNFVKGDTLKIPYISFSRKVNYASLQNLKFINKNNEESILTDVWQTVEFKIDNSVFNPQKIEDDISYETSKIMLANEGEENRKFCFNNTFAIYIKESSKEMPYFAAYIEDISKFN